MPADFPSPQEVKEFYDRTQEAFGVVRNSPPTSAASRFFGMTLAELDDALEELRSELDAEVSMTLIASVEAIVRTDFGRRVGDKLKDPTSRLFRDMAKEHGDRVRLEDILDVWRDEGKPKQATSDLKGLIHYRHWVAHGRYWVRRGHQGDPPPEVVFNVVAKFLASVPVLQR